MSGRIARSLNVKVKVIRKAKKRIFSGIQPTGEPHLGNYIGAIRRWVDLQHDYESFFCLVDLHAMTLPWDPKKLRTDTLNMGAMLVACGIDPDRSVLFRQSQVGQHAGARMDPELRRPDGGAAADGPVQGEVEGGDRIRGSRLVHLPGPAGGRRSPLPGARRSGRRGPAPARRADERPGDSLQQDVRQDLRGPRALVSSDGARIMALDDPTRKMSKSATRPNSSISLADAPEAIAKKIRSAVTDSGREVTSGEDKPALTNLLTIFSSMQGTPVEELEATYKESGYAAFKQALADAVVEHLGPIKKRYEELIGDPAELERLLDAGALAGLRGRGAHDGRCQGPSRAGSQALTRDRYDRRKAGSRPR